MNFLPDTEFAINAAEFEFIKLSSFMTIKGHEFRMSFDSELLRQEGSSARERITLRQVKSMTKSIKNVWEWAQHYMQKAQEKFAVNVNKNKRPVIIKLSQKIWLNMKNIKIERPFKKLDKK